MARSHKVSRRDVKSQLVALSKKQLIAALLIILSMLLPELRTGKVRKSLAITESVTLGKSKKKKLSAARKKALLKAITANPRMSAEAKRKARKSLESR